MTIYYSNKDDEFVKSVPVVRQLHAIFDAIPDEALLADFKAPTGTPGYTVEVLY